MPFFMDYYYLILVLPAVLFAFAAQVWVQSTFKKYSRIGTRSGMTGRDACLVEHAVSDEVFEKLKERYDHVLAEGGQ